ncbi:chondroitin sulfate synthase 2 [Anoplolepis gracilipes]|uniref:chondroitin sulfate synthase 2 n=1 Tax=Anoplolepis gracilipes TaxID=354296 RepID=UPI003B9FAA13
MRPLFKVLYSLCWSNAYLIMGICMGLSFSLLLIPIDIDRQHDAAESFDHFSNTLEDIDPYEPRINTDSKPQPVQKAKKAFVRPRYYSTELGIREKIFVGIITSREHLHSRDVALNKTIAHIVDKIRYFISIPEGTKPNVSFPGIVGFTDTRSILKPFHALKYIIDNYLESYDYYFLIKDVSYVNARGLVEFVNKISVSQNVHIGAQSEINTYCSLESGILLSNSVIQEIKNNLDWCVKNAYSDSDDINVGRCILHSTSMPCSNRVQGQNFTFTELKPVFNFEKDFARLTDQNEFQNSLSIYPIYDHILIYKLNMYFAAINSIRVHKSITSIRKVISTTAHLGPPNQRNVSWPIGNQPGNRPLGRFDILRWSYFNESHVFFETDFVNIQELRGDAKSDIDYVINAVTNNIINKYDGKLSFKKLLNGYQKFDASRGMDYVLDIAFNEVTTGKEIRKRIEVCKPLGKVEIIPVPYVTENTRINIIITINLNKKQDALNFMEHYAQDCMEKKYKTFLMMVLLYNFDSPSKGKGDVFYEVKKYILMLNEKYKKDQSRITWLSIRLPSNVTSIDLNPMLKIAVTDLCAKKFSPESLVLLMEVGTKLKIDYLNRVRMNTISRYQIFNPIPFIEFHPDIIYADEAAPNEVDVNSNYGKYDEQNYNNIAFYIKDYNAMRQTVETSIPLARSDKDIATLLKLSKHSPVTSLFEMYVSFSNMHIFRAVEPTLKIKYKDINCDDASNDSIHNSCLKLRNNHLGKRSQLARLILDYQNYQAYKKA